MRDFVLFKRGGGGMIYILLLFRTITLQVTKFSGVCIVINSFSISGGVKTDYWFGDSFSSEIYSGKDHLS